jgi:glycosyltransferase involved in cell wall biosynthesis
MFYFHTNQTKPKNTFISANISILMPVKNTAKFLPECLDSIISQDFQNWELIAVNDHSSDASEEILSKYAQKDSRIKVFKNKGKGIISALQLAYIKSSGEYLSRMDSDDICKPNKFEVLLKLLKKNGGGHIAIGQVEYFSRERKAVFTPENNLASNSDFRVIITSGIQSVTGEVSLEEYVFTFKIVRHSS